MKLYFLKNERGSVIITTTMLMTILSAICVTTLLINAQNQGTTSQAASWQVAMDSAESALNWGVVAINKQVLGNTSAWNGWRTASRPMPVAQPSGGSTATGPPAGDGSTYNYLIPADLSFSGEGTPKCSGWVMVDTGNGNLPIVSIPGLGSGSAQWYRLRATGVAYISGLRRVSNNRIDTILRNSISLYTNRKSGATIPTTGISYQYDRAPQVTRTIEVLMKPQSNGSGGYTSLTKNQFNMSGGAEVHGDVAIMNTRKIGNAGVNSDSDLKNTFLYGKLSYSGPAVKNTGNVQGTISTPFTTTTPTPAPTPNWLPGGGTGQYTPLVVAGVQSLSAGAQNSSPSNSKKYKVIGDATIPGGGKLTIPAATVAGLPIDTYYEIWITGAFTVSGSGMIEQQAKTHVTLYIDDKITLSGSAVSNTASNPTADMLTIYGTWKPSNENSYTPLAATFSGGSNFYGTVNAPFYGFNISGQSQYHGAFIGTSMTLSGSAQIWQDASLKAPDVSNGNYGYASWFEDNSDPVRNYIATDKTLRSVVY